MATSKNLKLKVLVDKEKKKVIFAESDKDFVDILLSFLMMPLGSIINILGKQSSLGCMDKLYQSIENLDECHFNTEACKEMLLRPLNAGGEHCEDLVVRIDESNPRIFFCCKKHECRTKSFPHFSPVPKARCGCGEIMDFGWNWGKKEHRGPNGDGVFLRGAIKFIISDGLCVMPSSTTNMHSVIENLGFEDLDNIQETCFELDAKTIHDLLKKSLTSESPLSDVYFQNSENIENPAFHFNFPKIEETDIDKDSKKVEAKLIICKSTNKVLYIEAEGGFVNLLLSFLTFPMGSIVKLLSKFSSVGCVDNIYKSLEDLSSGTKYIKTDAVKLLLDPKLAAHFSGNNSLFSLSEASIFALNLPGCDSCFVSKKCRVGTDCVHGVKYVRTTEMNPKLQSKSAESGGSYAKMEAKFLITDDLQIKPFSSISCFQTIQKYKLAFSDFAEKDIDVDERDALNLLRSCLTSQNPFDNVFLPKKQKKIPPIFEPIVLENDTLDLVPQSHEVFYWDYFERAWIHTQSEMRYSTDNEFFYKFVTNGTDDKDRLKCLVYEAGDSVNGLRIVTDCELDLSNELTFADKSWDRRFWYKKGSLGYTPRLDILFRNYMSASQSAEDVDITS